MSLQYLTSDYLSMVTLLEPLLGVKVKEDFATSLVHIMQKQSKASSVLSDIAMEEICRLGVYYV